MSDIAWFSRCNEEKWVSLTSTKVSIIRIFNIILVYLAFTITVMHNLSFHEHEVIRFDRMIDMTNQAPEEVPWYDFSHVDIGVEHLEDFRSTGNMTVYISPVYIAPVQTIFKQYLIVESENNEQYTSIETTDWHSQYFSAPSLLRGPPALA